MKLQTRPVTITLANGANHDIDGADQSLVRISGPTGAFSIDGIASGRDGEIVILYNTTSNAMTITDKGSSSSKSGNQINLLGNTVATTGAGCVGLIYDGKNSEWLLFSVAA